MYKILIVIFAMVAMCIPIAMTGYFNSLISSQEYGGFMNFNYPKGEPNYNLPKGYKLVYNSHTKEYACIVPVKEYDMLTMHLYLYEYGGLFAGDLWTVSDNDYYKNTDSSIVKQYAHLYHVKQLHQDSIAKVINDFK